MATFEYRQAEAARRLSRATLTDKERENLEDERDIAAANRAREEDRANPNARKTLEDLRRAHAEMKSVTRVSERTNTT